MLNFLRTFCVIVINIILTITIITFVAVTNVTGTINDTITSYAKTTIINNIKDEIETDQYDFEIADDEEFNVLADKYINLFIDGVVDGDIAEYNLKDDVINYLKNNKDEINSKYNLDIKDSDIEDLENGSELKDAQIELDKAIKDANKEITQENKWALNFIKFIRGNGFKIMCISIIVICILLIALLMWSPYKWMLGVGISSIVSGAISLFNALIMTLIAVALTTSSNVAVNVNIVGFVLISLLLITVGIVMLVIQAKLNKKYNKQEA